MNEPTRLLDDPSIADSLRADLVQAQSVAVEGLDLASGAAGLKAAIAAEATGTAAAAGGTAAGTSKGLLLSVAAVVAAGATGAAVWWATRSPDDAPLAKAPTVVATPVASPAPAAAPPKSEPPESELPEPELSESPEAELPEPERVEAIDVEVEVDDTPAPAKSAKPRRVSKPTAEDYVREAKLIADARRTMKSRPAHALKLLEQAATEFPRGLLREERQALRILTLNQLGRTDDARAAARRFLKQHRQGPYAEAVQRVLQ